MLRKEIMSLIEGIGSAVGRVASGISGGVSGAAVSMGSGIEGGLGGATSVGGMAGGISAASFYEGPMPVSPMGGFESIGSSLGGLEPMGKLDLGAMDLKGGSYQPGFSLAGEILFQAEPQLSEVGIVAEAENILAQAKINVIPANAGIQLMDSRSELDPRLRGDDRGKSNDRIIEPLVYPELPSWEVVAPQVGIAAAPVYDNYLYDRTSNWYEPYGHTLVQSSASTLLNPVLSPALEPGTKTATKTENQISAVVAPTILPQPVPEGQEEVIEEKVEKQEPKEILEEEESVGKEFYLEDEQASGQRKHEIKEAIVKARVEADRLGLKKIAGWLVVKFLPGEHEGNRSQVVKKAGPDGSYQETIEAISETGELESEEQAVARFNSVVEDKKPVKRGKEGRRVGLQEVARVFKYYLVKPSQPQTEVVKRVVKKKVLEPVRSLISISDKVGKSKTEPKITHFPKLAEALKQAA